MDRNNFEEYISAYLDNELSKSDRESFEEIIRSDSSCSIKFKEIKKIVLDMQNLPELKTSDNFVRNLQNRIDQGSIGKVDFIVRIKDAIFSNQNLGFAMSVVGLLLVSYMFINDYGTVDYYSSESKEVSNNINEENIYLSDVDSTEQYDEYDGDILQTTGQE
tara:strand:+ start:287 stop:772 length:486 start_codon:yes stop_codon:yes gene_type:complete